VKGDALDQTGEGFQWRRGGDGRVAHDVGGTAGLPGPRSLGRHGGDGCRDGGRFIWPYQIPGYSHGVVPSFGRAQMASKLL
jgi:hypothetical protein